MPKMNGSIYRALLSTSFDSSARVTLIDDEKMVTIINDQKIKGMYSLTT